MTERQEFRLIKNTESQLVMNFNGKARRDSNLTSERKQLIKRRIAEKFYDRDEVLLEVARRILVSHDLDDLKKNDKSKS